MKILRLLALLLPFMASAQNSIPKTEISPAKEVVHSYILENKNNWKITNTDAENWTVSSSNTNKDGTIYMYINQQVKGIKIFNAISSVCIKNGKVVSFAKRFYADAAGTLNTTTALISNTDAIKKTAEYLKLNLENKPKYISSNKSLHRTYFSCKDISSDKIRVDLVIQPVKKTLRLAWDVNIRLKDKSHWWNIRIDAVDGSILEKNDWTTHCDFGQPVQTATTTGQNITTQTQSNTSNNQLTSLPAYRVYPFPIESPNFGSTVLLPNPADATASPYGWHDTNGVIGPEYTITRGNNVYAYDDIANVDAPGTSPDAGAPLVFDFPINFSQQPVNYLSASLTNLFYLNNRIHDVLYYYGFDEPAGNFQEDNYTGTGAGNDYVIAECQDGGGTDNANFSTPDDGQNGWMQMYLWTGVVQSVLVINSPASIAGNYNAVPAGFGPPVVTPITANLVLVDDGTAPTSDACEPLVNNAALAGKIAVIDRGVCNFVDKVLEAQAAGALAVIMVNNSAGSVIAMGDNGNGGAVTIPSEMISLADGNLIKTAMGSGTVNGTLNPPPSTAVDKDGSLDNGIVTHEFGHGVSNRLTGGPLNSNCLNNAEQGGEGWSDFFALMFTTPTGAVGTAARGMGTYAIGQSATGAGIRRYPYSTDMAIDPETYGFIQQSNEVHDIGEIWCTVLWEMNWALVNQFGFDVDLIHGTSGNNIALQLVIEGLKLQPCGPGFLDGRDAILQADDNLYGGVHKCLIWTAFAKRGMGYDAIQGSADVAGDETEGFAMPPSCLVATNPPNANFVSNNTVSCNGLIHFIDSSTSTPQAWHWSFGDGDTSNLQSPTHTYNTSGTFTVRLIVTNTLGVDTLVRPAYITIAIPGTPTVTGNTVICGGATTTLTANVSPGNTAEWRDMNDSILFVGTVFSTPVLGSNTIYNVTQITPTTAQHVGPLNGSVGNGSYHVSTFEGHVLFTTQAPMRINSVWVDDSIPGMHAINLYASGGGTVLQTLQVNIPSGQSRVNLNLEIPTPGSYEIGVVDVNGVNLFRNSSGISYPYTINGLVSITGSNAPTNPGGRYYYLYDWDVQELPCASDSVPVNIIVNGSLSSFSFSPNGLTVQLTNTSSGSPTSWSWDFGNGDTSNLQNPSVTYGNAGTYTISLTVTYANGCQSTSSHVLTVTPVGINEATANSFEVILTGHELSVKFKSVADDVRINIYDPIGKLLLKTKFNSGKIFTTQLNDISMAFILVNVEEGNNNFSKKVIFSH